MKIQRISDLSIYLRDQRKKNKLTQSDLVEQTGVMQKTISKLERDASSSTVESLFKLINALNLEITISPKQSLLPKKGLKRVIEVIPKMTENPVFSQVASMGSTVSIKGSSLRGVQDISTDINGIKEALLASKLDVRKSSDDASLNEALNTAANELEVIRSKLSAIMKENREW